MQLIDPDATILTAVREAFRNSPPAKLGVALSGGGDSMALLHILSRCFGGEAVQLRAVTVDHGLRTESAAEATAVGAQVRHLGIEHDILRWQGWDGAGNLQDQARRARYRLLFDWAGAHRIAVLALGHTADDQAETLLMRLARASGVTGLSAMPGRMTANGITVVRPLLGLGRGELRDYLRRNDVTWVEDPSNDDTRFERVRVRQALQVLEPLGLTAQTLAEVAANMAQAREALDWYSFLAARDIARVEGGDVSFEARQFRTLPTEIARRLLLKAVTWIGGAEYPQRRTAMTALVAAAREGRSATLGGCHLLCQDGRIWVCREYNAVRGIRSPVTEVWDGRWRVTGGPVEETYEVRPLGRRGLMDCGDWRAAGRPHPSALASPAVWQGDDLIAAPLVGCGRGWSVELVGGSEEFFALLLSH